MCTPLFACLFNTAHNEIIFRRLCALSDRPIFTTLKNMCIWNSFLFETDFFDVAAYVCTQNREKICFRAKRCPNGGDEEDRTPDPLLARQVLSQLSYTPIFGVPAFSSLRHNCRLPPDIPRFFVLLLALICFAAQVLSSDSFGICQRFFFEKAFVVGLSGLEPPTSRLSGVRSNRLSYRPILS